MSRACDSHYEMPDPYHLDEATAETLLGVPSVPLGDDALVQFLQDVRSVVDQPAPTPTPALARVLRSGFSTNPISPLATAAISPRTKERTTVKRHSIFRGLTVKALAVGSTLLVGVSTAAAAGALPGASQHLVAAAISSVIPLQLPGAPNATTSANLNATLPLAGTVTADTGMNVAAAAGAATNSATGASAATSAGVNAKANTAGNKAGVTAGVNSAASATTAHGVLPGAATTAASTVSAAKATFTSCLNSVISPTTGKPLVALGAVVPALQACANKAIGTLPLPAALSSCVSGVLNSLGTLPFIGSGNGQINLPTGCVPTDLSTCVPRLSGGTAGVGGVPANVGACATSIVAGIVNQVNTLLGTVGGLGNITGAYSAGGSASAGVSAGETPAHHSGSGDSGD